MLIVAALAFLTWADTGHALPNVVVIVTDDQRADGTMDTPAMQKTRAWFETGAHPQLGSVPGGTAFPNGIATTPLCCPARSSLLTGQYSHNHGVRNNLLAANILDDKTLQEYLKTLGYRTGLFGKYLNKWDENAAFAGDPTKRCEHPTTHATISCWDQWATFENQYFPVTVNDQGTTRRVLQYSTDYVRDRAESFIDDAGSSPFFLYVAPSAPHDPWLPEPQYENAPIPSFAPLQADPNFLEADRSDKPLWAQNWYIGQQEVMDIRAAQLRTLYSVDDLVDGIVRKVREVPGRDDNTIMFFVGDQGWHWGEHGREGKQTAYEDSVKAPFYMRWPSRVPAGSNPSLVGNVDLAPTVMDAVDASPVAGEPMDGQSLIDPAQRDGSSLLKRNHQFAQIHGGTGSFRSIRTREFVYIESREADGSFFKEYYDLTEDPSEINNLLGDGDPANDPPTENTDAAVNSLHEQLDADGGCASTGCPGSAYPTVFPADTKITVKPDANTNRTTARFVFTSSVPDSSFECRLSPATTWSNCGGSGVPYEKQFAGLVPNTYTLEVRAAAPGGAADSTPDSYTWTVDATADTAIVTKPAKLTNQTTAQFTFTSTAGSPSFECKLEADPPAAAPWQACTSPKTYPGLGDETFRFSVRTVGDPTEATHTWEVDSTPPVLSMNFPAENQVVAASELAFVPKADGVVQGFRCSLDGGAVKPCGGGSLEEETYRGLADGNHTVRVTATDFAGNTSAPLDRHFSVSTVAAYSNTPELGPEITDPSPDAEVRAVIPDGNQGWYIGGRFSSVGGVPKSNIAHITSAGAVDSWTPMLSGPVNTLERAADGTVYAGGEFLTVNGLPRGRAAAFSAAGALLSWNPDADGDVNDIELGSDFAYLAGDFNLVGGKIHRRIARVGLGGTGDVSGWGRLLNNAFQSGPLELSALALTNASVYAGGRGTLSHNGSLLRSNLAAINRDTGSITNWRPEPDGEVQALQLAPDGASMFVGGGFSAIGTGNAHSAAEITIADGTSTGFRPAPSEPPGGVPGTVNDIAVRDLAPGAPAASRRWSVLLGGIFNNIKGRYDRVHVADTSIIGSSETDGWPGNWNPRLDFYDGTKVNDVAISGNVVAVAGNFSASHFTVRRDLAFFRLP